MKEILSRERIEQYANDPRMCNVNEEIRMMARTHLALLDELEAEQRISSTWRKTAESNRENLEAAEKRIAEVESQRRMAFMACNRWADKFREAEKRIAELSHHLQCAHAFVEHTEAFGHAASNGILCCGDAQWNIDASKSVLAGIGKGE